MAIQQPTNRNLIIPHKYNFSAQRYQDDMRTLEMWARQPIQQLIAGSGVTLTPASGLATDANGNGPNPVTISASGGGGTPGAFGFQATHGGGHGAMSVWGSGNVSSTFGATIQSRFPIAGGPGGLIGWPSGDIISGTVYESVNGQGGLYFAPSALAATTILTSFTLLSPAFTGAGSVGAILILTCTEANGVAPAANSFVVASRQINFTSPGGSHLLASTDFNTATITGTDLTWTGTSNMALNCANSVQVPYILGWSVICIWDAANTYT